MKNKVLFMMPYINCGGVETTLISLLNKLDKDLMDIDLLIVNRNGVFLEKIPSYVNIYYLDIPKSEWGVFYGYKLSMERLVKQLDLINLFKLLKNRHIKLTEDRKENVKYFHYLDKILPIYDKEYDLAIDYFGYATFTTYYVANKVKSKNKFSWIHADFSRIEAKYLNEYYEKYDVIYGVSKSCINDFIACTSIKKEKCKLFYNFIDIKKIKALACENVDDMDKGKVKICTVGRLEEQKGYDLAIKVSKKLKDQGVDFCWYFVGEGSQRNYLEGCILENDLQNNVILLGLKTNPYPYIKNCDIYVQPSRYEGYCTTTNEARVLAKPIITTNVFGADEQFINQLNGIIVDFSEKEITNAIIDLIIDNEKRTLFVNELKKIDFNYDKQLNYLLIFDD